MRPDYATGGTGDGPLGHREFLAEGDEDPRAPVCRKADRILTKVRYSFSKRYLELIDQWWHATRTPADVAVQQISVSGSPSTSIIDNSDSIVSDLLKLHPTFSTDITCNGAATAAGEGSRPTAS